MSRGCKVQVNFGLSPFRSQDMEKQRKALFEAENSDKPTDSLVSIVALPQVVDICKALLYFRCAEDAKNEIMSPNSVEALHTPTTQIMKPRWRENMQDATESIPQSLIRLANASQAPNESVLCHILLFLSNPLESLSLLQQIEARKSRLKLRIQVSFN